MAATKVQKNRRTETPRPFLKWAGGKGQLVEDLLRLAPAKFRAYHEPFVGGGAVFFALYRSGLLEAKKTVLSDVNEELVLTWTTIREASDAVIRALKAHKYEKEYFYKVRQLGRRALGSRYRRVRSGSWCVTRPCR